MPPLRASVARPFPTYMHRLVCLMLGDTALASLLFSLQLRLVESVLSSGAPECAAAGKTQSQLQASSHLASKWGIFFCRKAKKKKKKKNKLNYSNLHCRLRTVRTGCRDLIWCEFNHPNPTDASSPRSLTQHQIDAREGKRQQIQQTHRAGLRYLQGLK